PARLYHWVQMGVLTQLTAASLLGCFGKEVQKVSALLLEHHLVHILVTDAHGLSMRTPKLSEACQLIESMKGREVMRKMAYETPERIIRGEPVAPDEPIPISARSSRFSLRKRFFSFSLKMFALTLLLSACMPASGPAIREIHPEERTSISWSKENVRWELQRKPAAPTPSSKPESGGGAIQQIETAKISQAAEEKIIQLRRLELSPREYILEKFKGKQVMFPEELPQERPEGLIYRIGPEDEMHLFVWQNPDLSLNVVVRSDGKISLPLVGEQDVAGLQISELENLLEREYARYIEKPNVTITVTAANSLKVFITGAVQVSTFTAGPLPSGFPLRGDKRLLTALSQVTILENADLTEAYIVRGNNIIPLDLDRLLKDGDMTQNVLLKPADTVVIPARIKEITILGEVNRPGRHKVERRTTVLDALSVAGGVNRETAVLDMAYVARRGRILPANFKRLIDASDLDQNIFLEDRDIIYVPSSKQNKIFVLGEVKSPKVVRFVDPMDLMEAIGEAGDFLTTANRQQVVVVRGGLHEPKAYAVNVLQMMKGQTHERFVLDRYDIVFVPRTVIADWNVFLSQLLPSVIFGNAVKDLTD
ncbi:MAG: CpsB/CapC family capsule biosynthesis tyrosine phosphatase, partial [Pseudomonadota bacterium]